MSFLIGLLVIILFIIFILILCLFYFFKFLSKWIEKKKILITMIAVLMVIPLYYSLSHIFTTLPVRGFDGENDSIDFDHELSTPEHHALSAEWDRKNRWTSDHQDMPPNYPFPNYSPDGRFYVDMKYIKLLDLWVVEMYRSHDNKRIGSFASHRLDFNGWCADSGGVAVRRLGASSGSSIFISLNIFSYNFSGPLLVAMVPNKEYKNTVFWGEPLTSPNKKGWYNADIIVRFTATKPDVTVLTPEIGIDTEGWLQGVTGTAVDGQGTKWSFSVKNINIDKTPPEIIFTYPAEGAKYRLYQTVNYQWSARDNISGIDYSMASAPYGAPLDDYTEGEKTFTVEAVDNAGNKTVKTIKYYVLKHVEEVPPPPPKERIWPK
ncbi:MAG: hypothetical protein JL50_17370 [Peptococcaceae bacterium BICA1-7]|nr:MAG: hypothetical protein JL50_17370 [Peptococcaceae bacterium BICA1-7]HBV98681.1 hypothetical protein [Desulfotomaculum sp.]